MSRIGGIARFDGGPPAAAELEAMAASFGVERAAACHREGGSGAFSLSPTGGRGVVAAAGATWVVADALLVDRAALDRRLAAELAPGGATDAQRILAAYRRWGVDCPDRLIGDFAFALWDGVRRRLLLARDPLGVRPLYYSRRPRAVLFGSEPQQLLVHPEVTDRLDEEYLLRYLVAATDLAGSPYRDVRQVPPGHRVIASEAGTLVERYWLPGHVEPIRYASDDEYADHFRELFDRAVGERVAGVEGRVAVAMSGGLDSCSVAASLGERWRREAGPEPFALTVRYFSLPECDEGRFVADMEARWGLECVPLEGEAAHLVEPAGAGREWRNDPPRGAAGQRALLLENVRRRGARFLLTGLAGDNLMQGSWRVYLDDLLRGRPDWSLAGIRRHARLRSEPLAGLLVRFLVRPLVPPAWVPPLRRLAGRQVLPDWIPAALGTRLAPVERAALPATPRLFSRRAPQAVWEKIAGDGDTVKVIEIQAAEADRLGIEVLHPFCDRRLAEFVLAVPPEQLGWGGETKRVLRRAMADRLPRSIRERRSKTRFVSAFDRLTRQVDRAAIGALLESPHLAERGWIEASPARDFYARYLDGDLDGPQRRWRVFFHRLVTLEQWLRWRAAEGVTGAGERDRINVSGGALG